MSRYLSRIETFRPGCFSFSISIFAQSIFLYSNFNSFLFLDLNRPSTKDDSYVFKKLNPNSDYKIYLKDCEKNVILASSNFQTRLDGENLRKTFVPFSLFIEIDFCAFSSRFSSTISHSPRSPIESKCYDGQAERRHNSLGSSNQSKWTNLSLHRHMEPSQHVT